MTPPQLHSSDPVPGRTVAVRALAVAIGAATSIACANGLGPQASTEEGVFYSGTTRLSYAFDIPVTGTGPYPTIVFGHDSGPNTKDDFKNWARHLVDLGFATLRFDKRGVGDSDGVYRRGFADFDLLASDLEAALDFAATDPRVDTVRMGLMGSSQAGWILPIVATRSARAGFAIFLSAPAVTVAQHNFWDAAADDADLTIGDLSEKLADFDIPTGDFDPRPFIEAMDVPALWLLGEEDRIIPARETATIVTDIAVALDRPFTVVVYPHGNHGLRDVRTRGPIDFWSDLLPWVLAVVD